MNSYTCLLCDYFVSRQAFASKYKDCRTKLIFKIWTYRFKVNWLQIWDNKNHFYLLLLGIHIFCIVATILTNSWWTSRVYNRVHFIWASTQPLIGPLNTQLGLSCSSILYIYLIVESLFIYLFCQIGAK